MIFIWALAFSFRALRLVLTKAPLFRRRTTLALQSFALTSEEKSDIIFEDIYACTKINVWRLFCCRRYAKRLV